jgi:hypothetical protein
MLKMEAFLNSDLWGRREMQTGFWWVHLKGKTI